LHHALHQSARYPVLFSSFVLIRPPPTPTLFPYTTLFRSQYKPEPEDQKQTSLHIIGVNLVTVSAAQQLSKGMYDVQMYTDNSKRSEEHTSELQSRFDLVCRLLLDKKNNNHKDRKGGATLF